MSGWILVPNDQNLSCVGPFDSEMEAVDWLDEFDVFVGSGGHAQWLEAPEDYRAQRAQREEEWAQ